MVDMGDHFVGKLSTKVMQSYKVTLYPITYALQMRSPHTFTGDISEFIQKPTLIQFQCSIVNT